MLLSSSNTFVGREKPTIWVARMRALMAKITMDDISKELLIRSIPRNVCVPVNFNMNARDLARDLDNWFTIDGRFIQTDM